MKAYHSYTFTERFRELLVQWGFSEKISGYIVDFFGLFIVLVASILVYYILKFIINRFLKKIILKSKSKWDDYLYENKVFTRLCLIVPALIINLFVTSVISDYPKAIHFIQVVLEVYSAAVLILVVNSFLNAIYHIYGDFEVANTKPIKGYIQILKIIVFVIGGIILSSMLIGQSPLTLLAGLGAFSAVLLLIFKDPILGFVAGVQLSTNNILQIGDWISMPSHNVDGTVIDISLVIVKVRNWDNSVSTIPTYTLISESFQNWRDLMLSGGRRMKRFLLLDINSIKPGDDSLQKKLGKYQIPEMASGKDLKNITNLGYLRYYLMNLLRQHPDVNQQMTILVRQLQTTQEGLPIEIVAYSLLTDLALFENFQSALIEHIISVLPDFDLRLYQKANTLLL
ncbi:MAG: mechanosensitive ion channel domain-containing protein [Bacteroidales bacterium]|jgi:miniconductance mechanosensitive channel